MTENDERILKRYNKEIMGNIKAKNYQSVKRLANSIIELLERKQDEK